MDISACGTVLSAVGTTVELLGVMWLAVTLYRGRNNIDARIQKGVQIYAEYVARREADEDREAVEAWKQDQFRKHHVTPSRSLAEASLMPMVIQRAVAEDQLRTWKGGAIVVFIGLLLDMIGSWMQTAS